MTNGDVMTSYCEGEIFYRTFMLPNVREHYCEHLGLNKDFS